MKSIAIIIAGVLMPVCVSAATLRVNNTSGSAAQYSTFDTAQEAAQDGDVIIFDGSTTSYGKIVVTKNITLQGPGYFLDVNDPTKEGYSPAKFDEVDLNCDGAKVTGLYVDGSLNMRADNLVVTRCYIKTVSLCPSYSYTNKNITNGVIHQNYILYGISGDSYSVSATYMQVTNNIIAQGYNVMLCNMDNSVISRNTAISNEAGVRQLTNCVIENNIAYDIESESWENKNNTYVNNYSFGSDVNKLYGSGSRNDAKIKDADANIATDKGAFSGDDPYVLSGLTTGPVLQDVIIPESVV